MAVSKTWQLFVDGASRGNPGPSGAGIHLLQNQEIVSRRGYYLGRHTNNEAEYLALLIGIFLVKKEAKSGDMVHVFSDSQLLIKQMRGEYRVRKPELQTLHSLVVKYAAPFACVFEHVFRENNTHADALANAGIDKKTALPASFVTLLRSHDVQI